MNGEPSYIDSHAHLTSDALFPTVDALLERAQEAGVIGVINICTDVETLVRGIALSKRYPWVYNTAATTPHDVEKEGELYFDAIAAHARRKDLVALGETGLDYFYAHSPVETQKKFLRRYLQLALECQLPIVIHCREAFADFFEILDAEYKCGSAWAPGVLHCFTGTIQEAEQVINRGWYLSLSGIVTYKKSEELRLVAKTVPLSQLLIETDSPYLAPQKHRGKTNEPAFLSNTAEVIAAAKGISLAEVAKAAVANAKRVFSLS